MAICDPSVALPVLHGVVPLEQSGVRLTPAMQQAAAKIAYDGSVPIGAVFKYWFDNIPILIRAECHSYTEIDGERIPGAYHGGTVYVITDLSIAPPHPGDAKIPWGSVVMLSLALFGASFTTTSAYLTARQRRRAHETAIRHQIRKQWQENGGP